MISRIISKIKKIYIGIAALAVLAIFYLFNIFNKPMASDDIEEVKAYLKLDDGYYHEPMMIKYGGLREPFLPQLLRIHKIHGTIRRAADKKPVEGLVLKICKPEMTALSDKNGNFEFEIYNIVYDTFEVNVYDAASENILQVINVKFEKGKPIDYIEHGSIVDETTVEVIL